LHCRRIAESTIALARTVARATPDVKSLFGKGKKITIGYIRISLPG